MSSEKRVLVVDDEEVLRDMVQRVLKFMKLPSDSAEDGLIALEKLKNSPFDIVIADIRMPNMDGMQLLKAVRKDHPETDVVIMTAHSAKYSYIDVVEGGAVDYIIKPFSVEELKAKIERVLKERKTIKELKEKSKQLEDAYAEILMLKDEEENTCRDINSEKEFLAEEVERLKETTRKLEEQLKPK